MSKEMEEPLTKLSEGSNPEIITESAKEIEMQDILVCGKCHKVYYFVEEFEKHKEKDVCKGNGELKETLIEEKKPQIWAFTLWKNTKLRNTKEEDKPPTSWSLYQLWQDLEVKVKNAWIKAGENVQALIEITTEFEKTQSNKRMIKAEELTETEDESDPVKLVKEKDPLEINPEKSLGVKKVLKSVQMNNKVTAITRKKQNTRKAVRTGCDPKVEFLVEEILSKRYNPRKRTFEYLIKWENCDANEECTWEPAAALNNCKLMVEEFDKNLQIQREQQRIQKILAKKKQPKKPEIVLTEGRPQRTSKQKALNQVKQWCGNMEADENLGGKRIFSDDSDEDDSFEKRLKYEDYSSDSENESPVVTIKRIPKSQNGVDKKLKLDPVVSLPNNILIPDAKGIVRINQKQIPSLSSGVYVMSKTAGIIKLDTKASKLATSGGQTVLKVAPKIGQTSIKVIKRDISNGSTTTTAKTANILRAKPVIRNYSSKVYMQKRNNAQNVKKSSLDYKAKEEEKEDEESDGIEELEFPTDIPIPAPDSPPPDFTLCPLTGKVLDKDGQPLEEPEESKQEETVPTETATTTIDNLVNMAAADILQDLQDEEKNENKSEETEKISEDVTVTPMEVEEEKKDEDLITSPKDAKSSETQIAISVMTSQPSQETKSTVSESILSTALTNANIAVRRTVLPPPRPAQQLKPVINRTTIVSKPPQAIITRITPATNTVVQRSRVVAPKPKEPTIIRKRTIVGANVIQSRSVVRRIGETKVYATSSTPAQVGTYVATPTTGTTVISMPSLIDTEPVVIQEKDNSEEQVEIRKEPSAEPKKVEIEDSTAIPTTSSQNNVSLSNLSLGESETPLLITGEDGTIYQVAGQNEDGQTILITQGEDGEQQCLLVAPENVGLINQAIMKPAETADPEVEQPSATTETPEEEVAVVSSAETEEQSDDSQVVAHIVSANPPSPGGTRKVVLMLPDGNFMMTEVTAEQYAALELDK